MFFHVTQSLLECTFDSKSSEFHFVLYKYNKGKEKFKKRYDLRYDASQYDEKQIMIKEVSCLPFGIPVIVCLCNKKESVDYDVLQLSFNQNDIKILYSFSYDGYFKNLLIEDGPSVCATIGSINYKDYVLNTHTTSGYDYRKAVILEQPTTLQISHSSVNLSIPKDTFSHSTLLHCLQIEMGFILLSTSPSENLLTCTLYVNNIFSPLFQSSENLQEIHVVSCLPFSYALQFDHECVIIQNDSILARKVDAKNKTLGIAGNPVFIDDFMSSGIPQFCSISSNASYSLLSFSQQLLQSHALHSHSQVEKRKMDLDESKRQIFIQGLDSKRIALDKENTYLQKEHLVLTSLMQNKVVPKSCLKPFIINQSEDTTFKNENEPLYQLFLHVDKAVAILQVETEQSMEVIGFFPSKSVMMPSRVSHMIHLFWFSEEYLSVPFYLLLLLNDKEHIIKRVDIQKVKRREWEDFPRFLFSNQLHLSFDGYLTATTQYKTLTSGIHKWINDYVLKKSGRIDMISPRSTFSSIYMLKIKLIEELAFLRSEINNIKQNGYYRMKREWLVKRSECDQLTCKLIFILGGMKEVENWYHFIKYFIC